VAAEISKPKTPTVLRRAAEADRKFRADVERTPEPAPEGPAKKSE
jgi:hypothetical protein